MKPIEDIAREIVAREGGFVNDPDDPGGATKYGVTLKTLRNLGLDLNADGVVDLEDISVLSTHQAMQIFIAHYFEAPKINTLPQALWPTMFDMYVNAGANAVQILQRLLSEMGFACAVDGVIGPQTAQRAHEAWEAAPNHLVDAYGIARRNYYYALGDRRRESRKFARRSDGGKGGWITRAETFINARYHLSARAHAQRVASWG